MSDKIPPGDEQIVAAAKQEYADFIRNFEAKYGYGIGARPVPSIGEGGQLIVQTAIQLVKLPPKPVEVPPSPTNVLEEIKAKKLTSKPRNRKRVTKKRKR